MPTNDLMEKLVSLCKRRGFLFPSSEIYGGLNSFYDYGPLGVELKNNVKRLWWQSMVQRRDDVVGLDAAILMHPKVWEASGHLQNFTDPLVDCKQCKRRFRADHLLEATGSKPDLGTMKTPAGLPKVCPECGGELTEPRRFNLMFKTFMGPLEEASSVVYLRPETAQGIFVNFKNVRDTMRPKLPFGIAQIGKAFRNEITPGNFIFRTREFEQMECEYFCHPREADRWYDYWRQERFNWYVDVLGINKKKLRLRDHKRDELAHYAKACADVEYQFPFSGWSELEGIANRQDFDLKQHATFSGQDLEVTDEAGKKFTPYVIEPSAGADRATLTVLVDAYTEVEGGRTTTTESNKELEVVMRFDKKVAPIKVAVLPLSKKETLARPAREIFDALRSRWTCTYDEVASIGRRYRRQDEIGTPYCVTVDFETLEDKKVTVRDRDSMKQERIGIEELEDYFKDNL
ncbi:MAG: glycine--tRNA ligase [Candidatus Buchananbacteria bacterium RIFCSPLOWO2_01_FULL_56_15]|uniref:Glycine--tRNA ligase n=1 Tax=Candidatus Buchananbacteria bacterium RIFCSPLOWO2_01_FULL_56_15 TaxID=1797547 RepID=A0A1G1YSL9_9BACT|nr:MAG: glycine--tRNA ligase [Candidatus Buchananbacteria bacterium RIFCSPLOWO2_01_FULL_56_15]